VNPGAPYVAATQQAAHNVPIQALWSIPFAGVDFIILSPVTCHAAAVAKSPAVHTNRR
jgi:hypothetical protein